MSWSMPALYFLTSRSPSPPPLPSSQAPTSLLPSSSFFHSSLVPVPLLQPSSIPSVAVILSPAPVRAVCRLSRVLSPPPSADPERPPVSGKKAKRKASSSSVQPNRLLDEAGTSCIHLCASPLRPLRAEPLLPPGVVAAVVVVSRWSSLPPFLPALLVPFLCGSSLAAAYRLSRAWHADFTPLHLRQQSAGETGKARPPLLCLDQESAPLSSARALTVSTSSCSSSSSSSATVSCLTPAEAEFSFSSFSSSPTAFLRSVFAANLSPQLHTLKLSTVRLTRESCSLLSCLLFLAHLELRLFESLSDDWRTDFLLSPTGSAASPHSGLDSVFLHGGVFCDADAASPVSSSSLWSPAYGRGALAGVSACAASLLGCLRRLRHLHTLSVLQFVDEQDSDDHPVCSAQSEAILLAMEGHPHLTQLQLRQARFAPPVFASSMTAERLRAIPHLQSVHIVDTAAIFPSQCNALMACAGLTDVRICSSSSRPGVYRASRDLLTETAASQLFCSANLPGIAIAWRSLRVLIAEDVRVESRAAGREPRSAGQNVEEAAQLLTHCQLQPQSPSSAQKQRRLASPACPSSCAEPVDVTAFIAALSSFQQLTTLHLSFLPPHRADCSDAAHCSFSVDPAVWSRVWQPSSSLPRQLQHLTLPVLHGAELSLLLSSCRRLSSLTLLPPVPVASSFLMSLFYLSGSPALLRSLSLPLEAGQVGLLNCLVQRVKGWREAGGRDRDAAFALPQLQRVSGWSHWRDELLVDWTASTAAGAAAVSSAV